MIKSIKLKIPDALKKAFANPKGLIRSHMTIDVEKTAINIQREAKINVVPGWGIGHKSWPMTHFEGRLNRSIVYKMVNALKALVGAYTPYAAIQEYGGIIRPVMAKALFIPMSPRGRKTGPVKGGAVGLTYGEDFIFLQKVEIKPKSYFSRAVDKAFPSIKGMLENTVATIAEKMGFK
jgi:phage gpG-like protein